MNHNVKTDAEILAEITCGLCGEPFKSLHSSHFMLGVHPACARKAISDAAADADQFKHMDTRRYLGVEPAMDTLQEMAWEDANARSLGLL